MCICIGAHTTYKLASTLGLNFLVLPITYLGDPELFSLVFCDCSGTFEWLLLPFNMSKRTEFW